MAAGKLLQGVKLEVIGLLPAAGQATRVAPLPCSKELYPIGFRSFANGRSMRPKVAAHYLLEKMRLAGVSKVYIVLREGKWDIPSYFGDGSMLDMNLAYLTTASSLGPPYTLDQAYPFVRNALVAFGFPDIIFKVKDVYKRLLSRQSATGADVVLGLFPAHKPSEVDIVHVGHEGRVNAIRIKPRRSRSKQTWVSAVWTPTFSRFMHEHLIAVRKLGQKRPARPAEMSVGHVFQAAISLGLQSESVSFEDDTWVDIGTPHDLVKAIQNLK